MPNRIFISITAFFWAGCSGVEPAAAVGFEQALVVPMPVLSAAAGFSVLSNARVICTDGSIDGNVGTQLAHPVGEVANSNCPISTGLIEIGSRASTAGFSDFSSAYDALRVQSCTTVFTGSLGNATLTPGTYCFAGDATLTGTLTLDGPADGTWLFKVGGALTTSGFSMVLANGANACNVSWWIAGSATLTDSDFRGNLFAGGSDVVTRGSFEGRAFAKGDVTVTETDLVACVGGIIGGGPEVERPKCNQGLGNGAEGCDPGNSNRNHPSNDENGGTPGRKP